MRSLSGTVFEIRCGRFSCGVVLRSCDLIVLIFQLVAYVQSALCFLAVSHDFCA